VKRFIAFLLIVGSLLVAFSLPAMAWYCQARSPTGALSWATNHYLGTAQYNALYECAIHTPTRYICVITWCK
jgi:hypothetical protein